MEKKMKLSKSAHKSESTRKQTRIGKWPRRVKTPQRTIHNPYRIYMTSLSPKGRKGMQSMLSRACCELGWKSAPESYPWHQLRFEDVQKVRTQLLEKQYAINSVNLTLSGLRSIARTAFNLEQINADQLMRIQAVKPVKGSVLSKGRSLAAADIKAVNRLCLRAENRIKGVRDRALFLLGCTAGLRCGELISLSVAEFDTSTRVIRIMNAKGRKQREIHLCKPTADAVKQWIALLGDARGALFRQVLKSGQIASKPLTSTGVGHIMTQLYTDSGIARFSPHDLRRTFITQLLRQGHDINTVRQLAGHASINTTVIYDCRDGNTCKRASQQFEF
jgi:site-specific recombinase XerD